MFYNVFKNRNYANFECNNVKSKIKSTQINKTILFEINISRSLSLGISFLSLSKSFNNLKTKRALAKLLYRDCKYCWFSLVKNPCRCLGLLFWQSVPVHLCSTVLG